MPSIFTIAGIGSLDEGSEPQGEGESMPKPRRKRKLPPVAPGTCRPVPSGRRGTCEIQQCYFGTTKGPNQDVTEEQRRELIINEFTKRGMPEEATRHFATKTGYILMKGSLDCSRSLKHQIKRRK